MNTLLKQAFLLATILVFGFSGAAQWQNLGTDTNLRMKGFSFPTSAIGFGFMDKNGGGKEYLYKTSNSGLDWQEISLDTNFTNANFMDISFPSVNVGYVSVARFTPGITNFIYKTFNGGRSWVNVTPTISKFSYDQVDVEFINEKVGYVSVDNQIYKTVDGGSNWTSKMFGGILHGAIRDVDFFDEDHGVLAAWDGSFAYEGSIYFTNNGGATWDSLALDTVNTEMTKSQQVTKNLAFTLGGNSWFTGQGIYKTRNGGQSWDTLSFRFMTDSSDNINDFYFLNEQEGFIISRKGYVYSTVNGGVDWKMEYKEKYGLEIIESSGKAVYVGGSLNVLLTNDIEIKEDTTMGIHNIENVEPLQLYPNPISQGLDIRLSKTIAGKVSIFNSIGVMVLEIENVASNSIDTESLKPGLYFLTIENEGHELLKFVVD